MSQHGCPERLSNRSKGFQEDGRSQPTMEVLVETLTGTAFEMTVSPSDTIFAIKSKIFRVEGIPISQQHLLYNLKELEDSTSLREHAISDGARLRLVLGMRGGPISTRRLPAPAPDLAEPWPDIERLLDSNRDDGEWSSGSGCKVTVLVFRDGERVNVLRVRENNDGTYSPLDHNKYSSSLPHLAERGAAGAGGGAGGGAPENAVTQNKMMEIRRRMETMSLHRHTDERTEDKVEIQKTRSEETLSVPLYSCLPWACDGRYSRYDALYDASNLEIEEELKLSDSLAGSILVQRDDGAILEECLDSVADRQCDAQLAAGTLAPIPAADCAGALVGGGVSWREARPSPRAPRAPRAPHAPHSHSASSLAVRAPPPAPRHPPLSDALFSSSTSELEKLKRNSRMLPALSRHRNREHLHLSDEGLHLHRTRDIDRIDRTDRIDRKARPDNIAELELDSRELDSRLFRTQDRLRFDDYSDSAKEERLRFDKTEDTTEPRERERERGGEREKKIRIRCGFCKKRLSIATVHKCRCGAEFCAPHRYAEVHGCAYDYKAGAHQYLQRANPLVSAPKLPKI